MKAGFRNAIAAGVMLGAVWPMAATAQINGWGSIWDSARFGPGQGTCWVAGENSACLMLTCRNGGPFEIGLMAQGGDFGTTVLPAFIRVDGSAPFRVEMRVISAVNTLYAAAPYDPGRHAALLRALRVGREATVAVFDPGSNPRPYILGGQPAAVDAAMAACGAPPLALAAGAATPEGAPGRFVRVDAGLGDPQATALARTVMADILAAEPGTSVSASIAVLPDGRRILVAEHGTSTYSYGITGVGTFLYTAEPGGPFRQAYRTPGVSVWLDAAQLSEGFPDLWVRSYRGVRQPYGVWRHEGGRYVHQRNVPAE